MGSDSSKQINKAAHRPDRHELSITRQALGRVAKLGDLYDVITDSFTECSMFQTPLPPTSLAVSTTSKPSNHISVTTESSLQEKFKTLGVNGELQMSILADMIQVGGSAEYLSKKQTSCKSFEGALLYNVTTVVEQLYVFHNDVKGRISPEAKRNISGATHVVVGIHWGANCIIKVTEENTENNDKREFEANLRRQVRNMEQTLVKIRAGGGGRFDQQKSESWNKYSLEIFCDVLPDCASELPRTPTEALTMMTKIKERIEKDYHGKGKPLKYDLLPLACLPSFPPDRIRTGIQSLEDESIVKVLGVADYITELTQQIHDQLEELNNSSYVTTSEIQTLQWFFQKELESKHATLRNDLKELVKQIRCQQKKSACLDNLWYRYYAAATNTFSQYRDRYKAICTRKAFVEQCEKYGVTRAEASISIDQQIRKASADYENVYIYYEGERDSELVTLNENRSAFVELAKNSQEDSNACYIITWSEPNECVRIKHHRRGRLLHSDVAKELATKDVAQGISAGSRTRQTGIAEIELKVPCPAGCSTEKRSWTCINCDESLKFCLVKREVYCGCGHLKINQFRFLCSSRDRHGFQFAKFTDAEQQRIIESLSSRRYY